MTHPAYWQRQKIRALWPTHSLRDIAAAVKAGKQTIADWRDAGLLDPLPPRKVRQGKTSPARAAVKRARPKCQPCEKCDHEPTCRRLVRQGRAVLCERVA